MQRYQPRLLAFCRHMLSSREDAEDVLQEVFAAAFNAICADDRPINARPWLYRIARNRCLNHLRRPQPSGQDTMDVFERDGGTTTADTVHQREEFRHIVGDVQELPETQRTALLLREIDALTYEQIAEAMDTTVPSVKSLLVRARVALAEAAEARLLTCDEVRLELGSVAEGITTHLGPDPPPSQDLRALPHVPLGAAPHLQGAGRDLPDRPVPHLQEALDRQARLRRRRGRRRRRVLVRGCRRGRHGRRGRRRGRRHHRRRRDVGRRVHARDQGRRRDGRRGDRHRRRRRGEARERPPGRPARSGRPGPAGRGARGRRSRRAAREGRGPR